jgi:hypothetical protein
VIAGLHRFYSWSPGVSLVIYGIIFAVLTFVLLNKVLDEGDNRSKKEDSKDSDEDKGDLSFKDPS